MRKWSAVLSAKEKNTTLTRGKDDDDVDGPDGTGAPTEDSYLYLENIRVIHTGWSGTSPQVSVHMFACFKIYKE